MKRHKLYLLTIFLFSMSLFYSLKEPLASPYYQGKIITVVIGSGPGGGYDRMSRILIRHLPKYIPGNPVIIGNNMPGASSIIAANYLFNIAKPDGLTIGTFNQALPFAELLKSEGVRYNMTKYAWIGSTAVEAVILTIRADSPYKTFDDLLKSKTKIYLPCGGPESACYQFPMLLKEFIGLNVQIVTYPSSNDQILAVERKEVDGIAGTANQLKPFIERGLIRPLIRGRLSPPGLEKLPVDEDLTADPKGKIIMALRSATGKLGRPYVAPPRTPPELMDILKDAFAKVSKDPGFQEDAQKSMMTVEYVSADECLKVLNFIFNQPSNIVNEFGKYIKF